MHNLSTRLTVTDLFCGAGGSSLGAASAGAEIFLAVNHWQLAVETHSANFPDTLHDVADISATDPRRYPSTTVLLASPQCTHHTYAAGRKRTRKQRHLFEEQKVDPAAERSRATMWDVPRFAEFHDYEIVIVENVVEARKWAPFEAWMKAMDSLGYRGRTLYLNSMFFHPTPQSRDRMYVVFWKKENKVPDLEFRPRAWCSECETNVEAVQSWKNPHKQWGRWGRYRRQYLYRCPNCAGKVEPYYYAAFNIVDWSDLGRRIGDRDRPLAERTMERIQAGLDEYGNQSLLVQLAYSHARNNRTRPLDQPLPTQSTRQSVALLAVPGAPWLASVNYFRPDHSLEEPFPTQTTGNQYAVVSPAPFIAQLRNNQNAQGIDEALSTVTAGGGHHAIITPAPFLASYYGGGAQLSSLEDAVGAITTVDRHALVSPAGDPPAAEDCHFRMLQPYEVGRAMAFPDEYAVHGTKRDKVKQYGNAVTPPVMGWLLKRSVRTLM